GRWQAREDRWLAELRRIDPAPLAGRPEWTAYGVMRASLEGKVAIRPCHYELWNVSHVNLGWLPIVTSLAAVQPVGSDELRAQAHRRVGQSQRRGVLQGGDSRDDRAHAVARLDPPARSRHGLRAGSGDARHHRAELRVAGRHSDAEAAAR